jgi:hypothetical protein
MGEENNIEKASEKINTYEQNLNVLKEQEIAA